MDNNEIEKVLTVMENSETVKNLVNTENDEFMHTDYMHALIREALLTFNTEDFSDESTSLIETIKEYLDYDCKLAYDNLNTYKLDESVVTCFTDVEYERLNKPKIVGSISQQHESLVLPGNNPLEANSNITIGDKNRNKFDITIIKDDLFKLASDNISPEERETLRIDIIQDGWNPDIELTPENIAKSRARIEDYYTNNLNEFLFVNCIGIMDNLKPFSEFNKLDYIIPIYAICDTVNHETFITRDITSVIESYINKSIDVYGMYALESNLDNIPFGLWNQDRAKSYKWSSNLVVTEALQFHKTLIRPVVKLLYNGTLESAQLAQDEINRIQNFVEYCKRQPIYNAYLDADIISYEAYQCCNIL